VYCIEEERERERHTNDGDVVLGRLELPERNVDGDTTLTLGLQLVKNPCVLEGTLAEFGGFLRKGLASCERLRWTRAMCIVVLLLVGEPRAGPSAQNRTGPCTMQIAPHQKWTPPRQSGTGQRHGLATKGAEAYLLELLDGTLVNTTALVDQVCMPRSAGEARQAAAGRRGLTAGGGRLSGVNVADDDHVDVHLLFTASQSARHGGSEGGAASSAATATATGGRGSGRGGLTP